MSAESRDAAKAASVYIFWVYQGIKGTELDIFGENQLQVSRIRSAKQGNTKYLLHAMFLCTRSLDPLPQCGHEGDIWIAHPKIYYRSAERWISADTRATEAPRHPFLDRHLTMHPAHCAMQWIEKGNIRQHWKKGKWTQEAMENLPHAGIKQVMQRNDMKEIIGEYWTRLSSHQVSLYMSNVLPTFLDDDNNTIQLEDLTEAHGKS